MYYTVRYAHLESIPNLSVGEPLTYGDLIGRMGSTGQSKHNHLHIDVVEGLHNVIIRLKDISERGVAKPSEKQLNYFIDKDLFKVTPYITTPYMSEKYKEIYGKDHPAIDCVPIDRHSTDEHFDIFWNRSKTGTVIAVGFDEHGYGNYALIIFHA